MNVLLTIIVLLNSFGYSDYTATAYSLRGKTASGIIAYVGSIAADPKYLKLGTKIHIRAGKYTGTYIVRDTGKRVHGHKIDIWMPNRQSCLIFGRRHVRVRIL